MNTSTQKISLLERVSSVIGRRIRISFDRLVLHRTQHALSQLNDHMLRDIGLTREDIAVGSFQSRVRRESQERGW